MMKLKASQSFIGGAIAIILATSCCWVPWLAIVIGGATSLAGLSSGLEKFSPIFMAAGLGFFAFGVIQYRKNQIPGEEKPIILKSTITCPECGFQKEEVMPTDACQFFYDCPNCKALLKAKQGDCCVFCSYGTVPCPPIQSNVDCC